MSLTRFPITNYGDNKFYFIIRDNLFCHNEDSRVCVYWHTPEGEMLLVNEARDGRQHTDIAKYMRNKLIANYGEYPEDRQAQIIGKYFFSPIKKPE